MWWHNYYLIHSKKKKHLKLHLKNEINVWGFICWKCDRGLNERMFRCWVLIFSIPDSKTPAGCWRAATPALTSWRLLSASATTGRRPSPSPWPCASRTWQRSAGPLSCGWRRPLPALSTSPRIPTRTARTLRSSSRERWAHLGFNTSADFLTVS